MKLMAVFLKVPVVSNRDQKETSAAAHEASQQSVCSKSHSLAQEGAAHGEKRMPPSEFPRSFGHLGASNSPEAQS